MFVDFISIIIKWAIFRGSSRNLINNKNLRTLIKVAQKLALLGVMCVCFLVFFAASSLILVPSLEQMALKYMDWINCVLTRDGVYTLKTVDDCSELTKYESVTSFPGRPSLLLMQISYAAPSCVPVLFGVFFCAMRYNEVISILTCTEKNDNVKAKISSSASTTGSAAASTASSMANSQHRSSIDSSNIHSGSTDSSAGRGNSVVSSDKKSVSSNVSKSMSSAGGNLSSDGKYKPSVMVEQSKLH